MRLQALAPAKINLFLHVGPIDKDGYHPLTSLAAFADVGDVVTVEAAERLCLTVTGPFGESLAAEPDNLILRALRRLGEVTGLGAPPLAVTLDKRLPIAAGLGGGSSDAGAAAAWSEHRRFSLRGGGRRGGSRRPDVPARENSLGGGAWRAADRRAAPAAASGRAVQSRSSVTHGRGLSRL